MLEKSITAMVWEHVFLWKFTVGVETLTSKVTVLGDEAFWLGHEGPRLTPL